MYEILGFFAFVACFWVYGVLKWLYKNADDFFYFRNDGCAANWIVDGIFVVGMILLKLVLNPNGDFSPITIVRLAWMGYAFSGLFSIASFLCGGRFPASRLWTFAFRWGSPGVLTFLFMYFVVLILLFN